MVAYYATWPRIFPSRLLFYLIPQSNFLLSVSPRAEIKQEKADKGIVFSDVRFLGT